MDDALARKAFPGQSAVGKRILIRMRTPEPEWVQIIGVVAHQHQDSLTAPGREQIYFTDAFVGSGGVRTWALRTSLAPAEAANAARAAIAGVDRNLVVTEIETGDEILEGAGTDAIFSPADRGLRACCGNACGRGPVWGDLHCGAAANARNWRADGSRSGSLSIVGWSSRGGCALLYWAWLRVCCWLFSWAAPFRQCWWASGLSIFQPLPPRLRCSWRFRCWLHGCLHDVRRPWIRRPRCMSSDWDGQRADGSRVLANVSMSRYEICVSLSLALLKNSTRTGATTGADKLWSCHAGTFAARWAARRRR